MIWEIIADKRAMILERNRARERGRREINSETPKIKGE